MTSHDITVGIGMMSRDKIPFPKKYLLRQNFVWEYILAKVFCLRRYLGRGTFFHKIVFYSISPEEDLLRDWNAYWEINWASTVLVETCPLYLLSFHKIGCVGYFILHIWSNFHTGPACLYSQAGTKRPRTKRPQTKCPRWWNGDVLSWGHSVSRGVLTS